MFQDSLLIIKADYLAKRKPLLLYLLQLGFFIKGQRKICFSPELAAEFYQDIAEEASFMLKVILLSKGNSEAFILSKECAVQDLINHMVCYFGTSTEMERNIHVNKCLQKVQREICFIFPNYISEPIYYPEQIKFCANNPLVQKTITSLYDIVTNPEKDPHKSWKQKLAESLIISNNSLPQISNRCCYNSKFNAQEMAQQTQISCFHHDKEEDNFLKKTLSSNLSKDCSSLNVTTSSCMSCSGFDSGDDCMRQTYEQTLESIVKARTAPLTQVESMNEIVTEESLIEEHGQDCEDKLLDNIRHDMNILYTIKTVVGNNMNLEAKLSVPDEGAEIGSTTAALDILNTSSVHNKISNMESTHLSIKEDESIQSIAPTGEFNKESSEQITANK